MSHPALHSPSKNFGWTITRNLKWLYLVSCMLFWPLLYISRKGTLHYAFFTKKYKQKLVTSRVIRGLSLYKVGALERPFSVSTLLHEPPVATIAIVHPAAVGCCVRLDAVRWHAHGWLDAITHSLPWGYGCSCFWYLITSPPSLLSGCVAQFLQSQ